MIGFEDLLAIVCMIQWLRIVLNLGIINLRCITLFDIIKNVESTGPTSLMAVLVAAPFALAGSQPASGVAFLTLLFIVHIGMALGYYRFSRNQNFFSVLTTYGSAVGLGIGVFAVLALFIAMIYPTAENFTALSHLPMSLEQLLVPLAKLMFMVILIPLATNLLSSDKRGHRPELL